MPENTEEVIVADKCYHCGQPFEKEDRFYKSNSVFYIGLKHLPICRECLTKKFLDYSKEYDSPKKAMQRICIAYDLYYSDSIFNSCASDKVDVILGNYIKRLNMVQYRYKTFDTSLEEGFNFSSEYKDVIESAKRKKNDTPDINPKDVKKWGGGLTAIDYEILNEHYDFLKNANKDCDDNVEIFVIELCYTKMQQMRAVREGKSDEYSKLSETYRKTFNTSGLKTVKETQDKEEFTIGVNAESIEKYTPAEYYKNKKLYKDYDGLGEYLERFIFRPLKNLTHGSKDRDYEFFVKESEDVTDEYEYEE